MIKHIIEIIEALHRCSWCCFVLDTELVDDQTVNAAPVGLGGGIYGSEMGGKSESDARKTTDNSSNFQRYNKNTWKVESTVRAFNCTPGRATVSLDWQSRL